MAKEEIVRMTRKNAGSKVLFGRTGPTIRALDPWIAGPTRGKAHQLLNEDERARIAVIASIVRFTKGQEIYQAGDAVDAIYNIIGGVVKSFSIEPDGRKCINAFLFADDLCGLSEEGNYINSAKAITPVTAYRLPIAKLRDYLHRDAELEFHVICKLCQELRQAQRHAFLLARREALPKLSMFLQMLEELQAARGEPTTEIHLPMDRTEIGEYVGMSLAAVSRAFRRLSANGIIEPRNRRHIKIKNRIAFDNLVGPSTNTSLVQERADAY